MPSLEINVIGSQLRITIFHVHFNAIALSLSLQQDPFSSQSVSSTLIKSIRLLERASCGLIVEDKYPQVTSLYFKVPTAYWYLRCQGKYDLQFLGFGCPISTKNAEIFQLEAIPFISISQSFPFAISLLCVTFVMAFF